MSLLSDFEDTYGVLLPKKRVICPRCDGGRRKIDCWDGGMTASEMDEQGPEFLDDYLAGHYSVACPECNGANVVDEVDEERCDPDVLADWHGWQKDYYETMAVYRAEQRMGA